MIVVVNLKNKSINKVKSIKQFGELIGIEELDKHDNWFYTNLDNMEQRDYVLCENKKDLTFEFNGYLLKRI